MPLYYEGYQQAREQIKKMDDEQLLGYLDDLWGRDNLPQYPTTEQIRTEALLQCKREFTDTTSKEYELVDFYTKLHKAQKESK